MSLVYGDEQFPTPDEDQRLSIDEYNTPDPADTGRSDYQLNEDYGSISGYTPTDGDSVFAFIEGDLVAVGQVTNVGDPATPNHLFLVSEMKMNSFRVTRSIALNLV